MGKGKELFDKYGIKGFYLQSLFKFNESFYPTLEKSIELGRSFIRKEYQRKTLSLFLLWKGILYFLINHYTHLSKFSKHGRFVAMFNLMKQISYKPA
jgi:putative hemolysin